MCGIKVNRWYQKMRGYIKDVQDYIPCKEKLHVTYAYVINLQQDKPFMNMATCGL